MTTDAKPNKSFGSQLGNFFRILLRLIFTIILAIGLGVGLYYGIAYGIPALQDKYIQPVQDNALRLDDLEVRQAQHHDQILKRLDTLQGRLETLETQNDAAKEILAELQTQIDDLLSQVSSAQTNVQVSQETIEELATTLQKDLSALEIEQAQIQEDVDDLTAEQIPVAVLQNELTLVKAMELLTRAQQSLLHNNYGLAQDDLQSAIELLSSLQGKVSDMQKDRVSTVIQHLEATSDHLPNSPRLASNELEIAWQILISEEIGTATDQ